MDVRLDFSYGASWSPRPNRPIFKSSNVIFAKKISCMDVRLDVSYRAIWSPRPNRPIFKVKRSQSR
ncbi:hypothetical protein H5410_013774 [Solanum commersonii]|uniref:Uncharacterized protein n=1 Tax=Solanum commersonii TaxID=4109 RepID=A0A9J5ZP54_SOLCO|nr:hypothetical protein H5410_013774 [Solanum commersonii]